MTTEEYKKLNNYLNSVILELSKKDMFLIYNIEDIAKINDSFLEITNNYEIKKNYKENTLSYDDVYMIAREIIESIDSKYLLKYDDLIKTGQLDFDYEHNISIGSNYYHTMINNQSIDLIDIERKFNYDDVVCLIHEFFHYLNGFKEYESLNRYLFTEFISIYFEMYAFDYLRDKGIPIEELNYNDRLDDTIKQSRELNSYEIVLLAYDKFGDINEKTIDDLNHYICSISKEDFEWECQNVLNNFEKIENKYKKDIMYERDFNQDEYNLRLARIPTVNYRYIIGTLLAIYARKYSSIDRMINLNDTINQNTEDALSLLNNIGIDLNKPKFNEELMNSLEEYLNRFNGKKVM